MRKILHASKFIDEGNNQKSIDHACKESNNTPRCFEFRWHLSSAIEIHLIPSLMKS